MSPQSSTSLCVPSSNVCGSSCDNFINEIIHMADESYRSAHVRLDTDHKKDLPSSSPFPPSPPLFNATASTGGPRFTLRKKRKVSISVDQEQQQEQEPAHRLNSAFLSGLFAEINTTGTEEQENHYITSDEGESCPNTPVPSPSPRKKARISPTRSLARCSKSYASLAHFGAESVSTQLSTNSYVETHDLGKKTPRGTTNKKNNDQDLTAALEAATTAARDLIDTLFPHLPATVSDSNVSAGTGAGAGANSPSADLIAQESNKKADGQHVLAPETNAQPPVEPEQETAATPTEQEEEVATAEKKEQKVKNGYGWFLDLDDEEEHATIDAYSSDVNHASSGNLLAFQAPVSAVATCADAEAEVEWAKAADTVDDVLGDFF